MPVRVAERLLRNTYLLRAKTALSRRLSLRTKLLVRRAVGFGNPDGALARALFDKPASGSAELIARVRGLEAMIDYAPQASAVPAAPIDRTRLRVAWVIPDFVRGAGGHMTIFRIASKLEQFGHDVSFLIQNPTVHLSPEEARRTINRDFQPFGGSVWFLGHDLPRLEGDALIATDRFTCYPVQALGGFRRKFYFVQDHESQFYAAGAESLLSENTYSMGFDCLCAGPWLAEMMESRYGLWARSWPLAYDADVYRPDERVARAERRIAFYARYVTPRRAVELGMMALDILHSRGVDFHVDFFGWDLPDLGVPYPHTNRGVLSAVELADLYRRASLGVVFSVTNHSLVNREMMACGLPVLDLDLANVRAVFPQGSIRLARPDPASIADGIGSLLADPASRGAIARQATSALEGLSWERSARIVESALLERLLHVN